uniref:hypothetical protein n=1 Tax=Prevotella sp. TaxID=59823 RepID=UPI004025ED0C
HVLSKNLIKLALIRSIVLYFFANLILLFDYITIFKLNLHCLKENTAFFDIYQANAVSIAEFL